MIATWGTAIIGLFIRTAHAKATTNADTAGAVFGVVVDVFLRERAGAQGVVRRFAGDHRAVQVGILFNLDLKAIFACKQAALFLHSRIIRFGFILAKAGAARYAYPRRNARACTGLLAVKLAGILAAGEF
ncbi:hypothetical protein HA050_03690 [Iodobacter sp. HSC-16F04]|uniref:Secreted protein n=1 Tax=Iodobacter violaceini TaxID=3044271 RepID=A0ABX0KSZ2_9NEIS|nr:hypothetical protein [Iodobacter violacea]NHQ85212.1 hypothetical protein [Iodobacter violacea]